MEKIRVVKRGSPSAKKIFLVSFLSLLGALAVASLIFFLYGVNPFQAYARLIGGSLGSPYSIGETLRRAIPLLLVGTGLTLAFRGSFWNIGAEGQLLLGAMAAAGVALFSRLPSPLLLPAMFLGGFFAGALWALLPALLKSKLGVNEVITTLMLNYVAMNLILYLVQGPWRGTQKWGFPYTDDIPPAARLDTIGETSVHWPTLILGLCLALLIYWVLHHTTYGFEIRVLGENPEAGHFAGMSPVKTTALVALVSGGLAGLAGVGEVAGVHHMLRNPGQISLGYGYTAIIVAWLARRNPLATVLTALFFGAILTGGDALKISLGLPFQVVDVLNGLILFFLIGGELLLEYGLEWGTEGERR